VLFQQFKGRYWVDYQNFFEHTEVIKPKPVRVIETLPELDVNRKKLIAQYRNYRFAAMRRQGLESTYLSSYTNIN